MRVLRVALAVAVLGAGYAVAACTRSPANEEVATAGGATPSVNPNPPDRRQWAQCMREHGVDVPDEGKYDPGRFDKKKAGPAEQACRQFLPPDTDLNRPMDPADVEYWRRWAQCMRDQGIDVEDPDPDGGPPGPRDTNIPLDQVVRAEDACQASAPPTHGSG